LFGQKEDSDASFMVELSRFCIKLVIFLLVCVVYLSTVGFLSVTDSYSPKFEEMSQLSKKNLNEWHAYEMQYWNLNAHAQ
jgi:hypothetical protein